MNIFKAGNDYLLPEKQGTEKFSQLCKDIDEITDKKDEINT